MAKKIQGEAGLIDLFTRYKNSAARKGLDFHIDLFLFQFITSLPCYYCNKMPNQKCTPRRKTEESKKFGTYIYNGIDRVDSNKGYVKDNLLPCCKQCNYAKRGMAIMEFKTWIKSVHGNFIGESNVTN